MPVVAKGAELLCERGEVVERQTQPPRPFTDASLLSAMTGIARFVQDKELKKVCEPPMAWVRKPLEQVLSNCSSSALFSLRKGVIYMPALRDAR
ncbi:hypothetical protein A8V49_09955 [Yersinia pestis]|nr:hypothetical protein A8V49_09955 [Yersinia pestis]